MVRIAFSSDLHLDINKVDIKSTLVRQVQYLVDHQVGFYFIAGDLFNEWAKSLDFIHRLNDESQKFDGPEVYFIAGNHDMVRNVTFSEIENTNDPYYLHKRLFDIPKTNYTVVGNNGWYDYSFAKRRLPDKTNNDFYHFKQAYWVDSVIDSPLSDQERLNLALTQSETGFQKAQKMGRKVIYLTHFVPKIDFVHFNNRQLWNMSTAMLGSVKTGELIDRYKINWVDFGHLHRRQANQEIYATTYIHSPVGYRRQQYHEWVTTNFGHEWQKSLKIIDL